MIFVKFASKIRFYDVDPYETFNYAVFSNCLICS